MEPSRNSLPHDPLQVFTREKIEMLSEKCYGLAIAAGQLRQVGTPEDALRAEGFDNASDLRMEGRIGMRLIDIARQARRFNCDIR